MVLPSTIRNKTGGNKIRCRFWSINAHAEQERPEFCRFGTLKVSKNPCHGCCSQWWSANKRWSNSVCQRIGFVRHSAITRKYASSSLTWKTLRRSRIFLRVDQWPETTTHQKWQTDRMQHGELRTARCPWSIYRLFNFIFTYISDIFIAGSSSFLHCIPHHQEVRVWVMK